MSIYIPKYFEVREFVPPEVYSELGDRSWLVMDARIVQTADQLREDFGPATINNWHIGGNLHYRGFRPPNCVAGAPLSQHRFGRAIDITFNGHSANEVRAAILADPGRYPYITALEVGVPWVHADCRQHDGDGILQIHP